MSDFLDDLGVTPEQARSLVSAAIGGKDRDKYIQQVFAKPFYEAGRPIGMEVTKIEQNSPLRYFGIQPGDVILNWNGQVINSEKKCYEIMNQYSGNINSVPNSNNITLIRNGTKVNLTIDLR